LSKRHPENFSVKEYAWNRGSINHLPKKPKLQAIGSRFSLQNIKVGEERLIWHLKTKCWFSNEK
jgi:hypothetical protein